MKPTTEQDLLKKLNGARNWVIRFYNEEGHLIHNHYATLLTKEEADATGKAMADSRNCSSFVVEPSKT